MSYTPTEWESTDVVTATRMNALEQAVGDMNISYTPNVWSNGDILSAEKMNALEQAVASGGGNPNSKKTVTGTLADPFGDIDLADLCSKLQTMDATAYLTINATALGVGTITSRPFADDTSFYTNGASVHSTLNSTSAFGVTWLISDKSLFDARMLSNGSIVDISSYASNIPTTLVVVWHPLPTEPEPEPK